MYSRIRTILCLNGLKASFGQMTLKKLALLTNARDRVDMQIRVSQNQKDAKLSQAKIVLNQ